MSSPEGTPQNMIMNLLLVYLMSLFRMIIHILHRVHSIDLKAELGFIPELPTLHSGMSAIGKMAQSDLAKKIDTDEKLVKCQMELKLAVMLNIFNLCME